MVTTGQRTTCLKALALAVVACVLCACASTDKPTPKPLEPVKQTIAGRMVWSLALDGDQPPSTVAVNAGVFTVAGSAGTVVAVQAESGQEIWRANLGARLSAGVGSDGRFASVVLRSGELVTLEAGRELWRKPLGLRVTTAPLVAGERVFVLATDRSVHAFDAQTGAKLWSVRRPSDPLTLLQAGVIAAFGNSLLVGQGPRLASLDPNGGNLNWEVAVAAPRGTNEVERLADLVGPASRRGDLFCARAFQSAVGCVNAARGTLAWSKPVGGIQAVAADADYVFAADASDRISAWKLAGGAPAWSNESLLHRELSAPVSVGRTVVFGDAEGWVHFLSRDNGEALLRLPTDGGAIVTAPVVSGNTLLVVTRKGGIFAFRPS